MRGDRIEWSLLLVSTGYREHQIGDREFLVVVVGLSAL